MSLAEPSINPGDIYPNGDRVETFDPFVPEFRNDPYSLYRRFRERDPVHYAADADPHAPGTWYLFRYADVSSVLKDNRFGRATQPSSTPETCPVAPASADRGGLHSLARKALTPRIARRLREGLERFPRPFRNAEPDAALPESPNPFFLMLEKWMLFRDPPEHTRLRSLVNKAFTARMVERLYPRIEVLADELLDRVQGGGVLDIIADFASPLPITVIAELLGVPPEDQERLRGWSVTIADALSPSQSHDVYERVRHATVALNAYLRGIMEERRRQPREDLLSGLMAAEEQGRKLSEEDILGTCSFLLFVGNESTVNLIGNGLLSLLRHPAQLELLKADPSLMQSAVEEMVRFESPVQMTHRYAFEDVEIGGRMIRKGARVSPVIGAANHDPEVFPNPDHFDISRRANPHIAYGQGIHFCLGATLARMEGQIAIRTLLGRFPNLRLRAEAPEWRDSIAFRELKTLPVSF